jgi:hypothetical protein
MSLSTLNVPAIAQLLRGVKLTHTESAGFPETTTECRQR